MEALFVHGMGRSPLSGWPLLRRLRRAGIRGSTFGYLASTESFARAKDRLVPRIAALAARDEYVLIGHSLGGVLLRAALNCLPPATRQPRHVFLLGSPVTASRLAQRLRHNAAYRLLTGDCGQLLASSERMSLVGRVSSPTMSIVGVRGLRGNRSPFGAELNDGVVSVSEVSAAWITEQVHVPCIHTLLPASSRVTAAILERLVQ